MKLYLLNNPRLVRKLTWEVVNLKKKHVTLMSTKPESVIWSHDTGQQIPCFDSCQLTITWIFNIIYAQ